MKVPVRYLTEGLESPPREDSTPEARPKEATPNVGEPEDLGRKKSRTLKMLEVIHTQPPG